MKKNLRITSILLLIVMLINSVLTPLVTLSFAGEEETEYFLELREGDWPNSGIYEGKYRTASKSDKIFGEGMYLELSAKQPTNLMFIVNELEELGIDGLEGLADYLMDNQARKLVAAINPHYQNTVLPLVSNGEVLHEEADLFFGTYNSGVPVIGDSLDYDEIKEDLYQAVPAKDWIIYDGSINYGYEASSRGTFVGIKDSGELFFFIIEKDYEDIDSLIKTLEGLGARTAVFLGENASYYLENSNYPLGSESVLKGNDILGSGLILVFEQLEQRENEGIHEFDEANEIATSPNNDISYTEPKEDLFSGDNLEEFGDNLEESEDRLEESEDSLEESEDSLEESEDSLEESEDSLEESEDSLEESEDSLEESEDSLEESEDNLEESEDTLEVSENTIEEIDEVELMAKLGFFTFANNFIPPQGNYVISTKRSAIVPGVEEIEYIYNNASGSNPVSNFIVDVELGDNVNIMAASKDYNKPGTQNVRDMARAAETQTGRNIVAAINADLNWSGTGLSNGPLVIDGQIYSDKPDNFFGVLKNGQAIIGDSKKFSEVKDDLEQAIRGMGWLVRDGEVTTTSTGLAPRTAIGIKADGTVFFHVVEGRIFPRSVGISLGDLAQIMKDYGAIWALNLDGGGSTTYMVKREGETSLQLRNIPSDGVERPSISSLLVYANVGDGKFHHAKIESESDIYTPGSKVYFTATGVDGAGGFADLPEGLTWSLADEDYGDINDDGVFLSSGREGEVIVQLKNSAGMVVGQGIVEILTPDEIHFLNEEFSLGFDEETDFGLRLTHEQRLVTYKDGDIIWEFFYDDEEQESIGSFTNNIFKSNSGDSSVGRIKATINGTEVSNEILVNVGKLPLIIFDFEDDEVNAKWKPSGVNGGTSELSIIHRDSGEPVRFGNHSLRMDFDFSKSTRMPSGSYAGFTDIEGLEELGVTLQLPGSPAGVGMWIYATEEVQGVWLRTGIGVEGTTSWKAFDLTPEKEGINWLGWKYVEVDLTDFAGPYTILPGEFIRLMITANSYGGVVGTYPVGSIYVDDVTVTYGHNPEDTAAPIISSIKINEEEVEDGKVIGTDKVLIETNFYDQEINSSGINYENINIYVDGVNYINEEGYTVDVTGDTAYLQNINLSDGVHEVKVVVVDNSGNETEARRYFEIDTGSNNKVYIQSDDKAIVGKDYQISLRADEINDIDGIYMSMEISDNIADFEIEYGEGFGGSHEYLSGLRILNVYVNRTGSSGKDEDEILKINFPIDSGFSSSTVISHRVNIGSIDYNVHKEFLPGFSNLPVRFNVEAPLNISGDQVILGSAAEFNVTDFIGNPIEGAEIFLITETGDERIGETDAQGHFSTDLFSEDVTSFVIYAKKDSDFSFEYSGQSLGSIGEETGKPFNITVNGLEDIAFTKNISWFSNTFSDNKASLIQYSLKSDYDELGEGAFLESAGTYMSISFEGATSVEDNYVVDIHNINISGLRSGQSYVYRVGNGDVWSEVRSFDTLPLYSDAKMLILGDIQTDNYEGIEADLASISSRVNNLDFVAQVGDFVDSAGDFTNWTGVLTKVEESFIGDLSMIHVLGNHEYYGDHTGERAKLIYNLNGGREDVYSGVYGNIYFGVVNYVMDEKSLISSLEWLVEDASKSTADWKVLFTHQPPYYSNPQGGSELFNRILPSYAEEAGFDFVISGHDHVYARTKPLISSNVDSKGVVYIIAGALGEKRYTAVNRPEFNFEYMNDSFGSIYLTAESNGNEFTIKAFETRTGEELDSYTKKKQVQGHDHEYHLSDDELVCEVCGLIIPRDGYTGFIKDEDNKTMYLMGGIPYKGLLVLGEDIYMFDEDTGRAIVGEIEIWGLSSTFDSDGRLAEGGTGFIIRDGETYYYDRLAMVKGWHDIEGDTYYFDNVHGRMYTEVESVINKAYAFTEDGKLIGVASPGFHHNREGTLYVSKSNQILHDWQEIDGDTYYFSKAAHGYMRTGIATVDGRVYEFSEDGKLIKEFEAGFYQDEIGTFYLNESGKLLHGWQEIDGETYYFSMAAHGRMRVGRTTIDGKGYDFDSKGRLIKELIPGFIEGNDGTSYIDETGALLHGWHKIDGATYYFSMAAHGYMRTGFAKVDGAGYIFGPDGVLVEKISAGFHKDDMGTYYINDDGDILHGWHIINGATYYFSRAAHGYMRTGLAVVEGKEYRFDNEGRLTTNQNPGFREEEGGIYYLDDFNNRLHGWNEINGSTYYFSLSAKGYMRTNRAIVDGSIYDFSKDGKLVGKLGKGFYKEKNGTFYVDKNGKILHGWQEVEGSTYYFSNAAHGYMRTDRAIVAGSIYEFTKDGKLVEVLGHGFHTDKIGTFYVDKDGKILHGWQELEGSTYYFSNAAHGYMRTGRAIVANSIYEFDKNGKLEGSLSAGFHKEKNGTFYVDKDGKILHGWQEIEGSTYYFSNAAHGYMRTGKAVVGGKVYQFSKDGKLQ